MPMLHTKFQCPTMPGTGLKVCGGMVGGRVVCKPILVFSLSQAEQFKFGTEICCMMGWNSNCWILVSVLVFVCTNLAKLLDWKCG